jgi:hypothetical protein
MQGAENPQFLNAGRERGEARLGATRPAVGCAKAVSATQSRPGRWIVLEDRQKRTRKAEARLFKIAHRRQRLGMKLVR